MECRKFTAHTISRTNDMDNERLGASDNIYLVTSSSLITVSKMY